MACDRSALPYGDAQEISLGQQTPEDAARTVRSLVLHNPHSYCYQHATVLSWAWTSIQTQMIQGRQRVHADVTGREHVLLQQLLRQRPRRLHQLSSWVALTQTWRRPQNQHDAGEFLTFLLRLLQPSCMQGCWQARIQDPHVRIYDSGILGAPIMLDIPEGSNCLQDCVNAWHYQLAPHGLRAPTSTLVFQLARFQHTPGRPVRKLQARLSLSTCLRIPVFTVGLQTQWHEYSVTSGMYHIGRTPSSGHYRAFLTNWGREGDAANRDEPRDYYTHTFLTEDGQSAQLVGPDDIEQLYRNTYILWCTRSEGHTLFHLL